MTAVVIPQQELQWRSRLREFIESNMTSGDDEVELRDDDNIFALGYVNSLFAMRLLNFVESLGEITVADEDIVLANFSSIDAMVALLYRSRGAD